MLRGLFIYRLLDRLAERLAGLWVRLRYRPFLHCQGACRFKPGVVVKPFWTEAAAGKLLSITLAGDNRIGRSTVLQGSGKIRFGRGSFCGEYAVIGCNQSFEIGPT